MAYEYPLQSEIDVRTAAAYLRGSGVLCEWSGVCLWITSQDMTREQVATIVECGGRYAQRRGQWYIRGREGLPRRIEVAA